MRAVETVCYWLAASAMMVSGVLFAEIGARWGDGGADTIASVLAVSCGALGGVLGVLGHFSYCERPETDGND